MKTLFTTNRSKDIILALLLTVCIICFAVILTVFFKPLYYFDIDYLGISQSTNLSYDVIKRNYDVLIQYQSVFYRGTLELPDFIMSETGRIHFEEVKRIFDIIQITFMVTGVASAIMIYQNIRQKEYRYLRLTSLFSIGIPLVIGFLASLDFNKAFVVFHQIVFRNNYWIFDYQSDPVIQILPEAFFMHCFIMIVVIIIVMSLILYSIYRKKMKELINSND